MLASIREALKNAGVRARVLALVLLSISPLVLLLLSGITLDRRTELEREKTLTVGMARLTAEHQSRIFEEARALMGAVGAIPDIGRDRAACHQYLRTVMASEPAYYSIGLVDRSGRVLCNNIVDRDIQLDGYEQVAARIMAPGAPEMVVGNYHVGRISGKPTFHIATKWTPVPHGEPGFIFMGVNLDRLSDATAHYLSDGRRETLLVEMGTATVLSATGRQRALIGKSFPDHALVKAMRAHPGGGAATTVGFAGDSQITGFAPLTGAQANAAMVVVSIPLHVAVFAASERAQTNLMFAIVAIVAALSIAWWVGYQSQLRPIRALSEAADSFARGNLDYRAALESWQAPEFRVLSTTLNDMARRLSLAHRDLQEGEARYRLIADGSTDLVFKVDENFVTTYASPASSEVLGFAPEVLTGRNILKLIHPDDYDAASKQLKEVMAGRERSVLVCRSWHKERRWIWSEITLRCLQNAVTGMRQGVWGSLRDITLRKMADETIAASEARFRLLAENSADCVVRLNSDNERIFISPACREMLGYEPEELLGGAPNELAHPDDRPALAAMLDALQNGQTTDRVQYRAQRGDGSYIWVELSGKSVGAGQGVVLAIRDISERKIAEDRLAEANRELERLATTDALTGLNNRRNFDVTLARELLRANRDRLPLSLLLIDVDKFKVFNDSYGHLAGDECLREIGARLQATVQRPGDHPARYGGEELAVILPNTTLEGAASIAERIRTAVADLAISHQASNSGVVTVSIGVATVDAPGSISETTLVRLADLALYQAKAAGRNRVALADQATLAHSAA